MADTFLFSNFAISALVADVVPGDEVIKISPDDVSLFPVPSAGQAFPLVLADDAGNVEVMYCTAIASTGQMAVERGQEGTSEKSWLVGTLVQHTFTAGTIFSFGTLVPRGTYNPTTLYQARDMVSHQGLSYVAVTENVGSAPGLVSVVWQVLYNPAASAGANLLWGGDWDTDVTYAPGAIAPYHGVLWRAKQSTHGNVPAIGDFWEPFALVGGTGEGIVLLVATGTNNYVLTSPKRDLELFDGLQVKFRVLNPNTGACTLKVDANSPVPFRRALGQNFGAGELKVGQLFMGTYVAATAEFVAHAGAFADALGDVLQAQITSLQETNVAQGTAIANLENDTRHMGVPPGAVQHFVRFTAPAGWLEANGAIISRVTYPALWAEALASGLLGSPAVKAANPALYGTGDGATTFQLPDLRGEFLRSWDNGRGVDPGHLLAVIQAGAIETHTHGVTDPGHNHPIYDPAHFHVGFYEHVQGQAGPLGGGGGSSYTGVGSSANTSSNTTGIAVTGSTTNITVNATGGAETRPRNVALLVCIKA